MFFSADLLIPGVTGGAVIGYDGTVFSTTPGFYVLTEETSKFRDVFKSNSNSKFKGLSFLDNVWMFDEISENYVVLKKENKKLVIARSKGCLVFGYHIKPEKFACCLETVRGLADMINKGENGMCFE